MCELNWALIVLKIESFCKQIDKCSPCQKMAFLGLSKMSYLTTPTIISKLVNAIIYNKEIEVFIIDSIRQYDIIHIIFIFTSYQFDNYSKTSYLNFLHKQGNNCPQILL